MAALTAMQVDAVDRIGCIIPGADYYDTQIYSYFQCQWAILKFIKTST